MAATISNLSNSVMFSLRELKDLEQERVKQEQLLEIQRQKQIIEEQAQRKQEELILLEQKKLQEQEEQARALREAVESKVKLEIAQMRARLEAEEKVKALQNAPIAALGEVASRRNRWLIMSLIAACTMLIIVSFVFYQQNKQAIFTEADLIQRHKDIIAAQNRLASYETMLMQAKMEKNLRNANAPALSAPIKKIENPKAMRSKITSQRKELANKNRQALLSNHVININGCQNSRDPLCGMPSR